jgi:hypothetical protein
MSAIWSAPSGRTTTSGGWWCVVPSEPYCSSVAASVLTKSAPTIPVSLAESSWLVSEMAGSSKSG